MKGRKKGLQPFAEKQLRSVSQGAAALQAELPRPKKNLRQMIYKESAHISKKITPELAAPHPHLTGHQTSDVIKGHVTTHGANKVPFLVA